MTDREKAIVMAYTGVCMLTGNKFQIFHEYVEDIMGRPIQTIEMGMDSVADEIKEKSREDFIALCMEDQEPCGDCISREAVIKTIAEWLFSKEFHYTNATEYLRKRLDELPTVTLHQKVGHWEWMQYDGNPNIGNWHCSECGCIVVEAVDKNKKGGIPLYKYCPQCGCKLQEVE